MFRAVALALLTAPASSLALSSRLNGARRLVGARRSSDVRSRVVTAASRSRVVTAASVDYCDISRPSLCGEPTENSWLAAIEDAQERGAGSVALLLATFISLGLANTAATSAGWLRFWAAPRGLVVAGHALSLRGWVNEGLMALFFFVVGLEIKQELRCGSLATPATALLPCVAALGGMVTPMLVYAGTVMLMGGGAGSMAGLAVPMATDIAFAMAVLGFFRSKVPASASAFLLTLATVDDLGAILVLATCFSGGQTIKASYLGLGAATLAALAALAKRGLNSAAAYAFAGAGIWWCLLKAGLSADIAGVVTALCVSTRAVSYKSSRGAEQLAERWIARLSPLATFVIMPTFALANTAVSFAALRGGNHATAPAVGIAAGLLIGKPIGIFGFTWLAARGKKDRLPAGMGWNHLALVSALGAIGFTMCLLLAEVSIPVLAQPLPKLAILIASAVGALGSIGYMKFGLKGPAEDEAASSEIISPPPPPPPPPQPSTS